MLLKKQQQTTTTYIIFNMQEYSRTSETKSDKRAISIRIVIERTAITLAKSQQTTSALLCIRFIYQIIYK